MKEQVTDGVSGSGDEVWERARGGGRAGEERGWFAGVLRACDGIGVEFGGDLLNKNSHGIDIENALAQVGRDAETSFGGTRSYESTLFCREAHGERDDAVGGRLDLAGSFCRREGRLVLGRDGGVYRGGAAAAGG